MPISFSLIPKGCRQDWGCEKQMTPFKELHRLFKHSVIFVGSPHSFPPECVASRECYGNSYIPFPRQIGCCLGYANPLEPGLVGSQTGSAVLALMLLWISVGSLTGGVAFSATLLTHQGQSLDLIRQVPNARIKLLLNLQVFQSKDFIF